MNYILALLFKVENSIDKLKMDKKLESSDIIPVNFVWFNKCEILDIAKLDYKLYFAPESPELEWTAYLKIIFALIVIITTVFGNGAVIIVITMNKLLRGTINYYLTNLAVVDIIFCVICLWVHVVNSVTFPRYVLGPFICKFNGFTHSKLMFLLHIKIVGGIFLELI